MKEGWTHIGDAGICFIGHVEGDGGSAFIEGVGGCSQEDVPGG